MEMEILSQSNQELSWVWFCCNCDPQHTTGFIPSLPFFVHSVGDGTQGLTHRSSLSTTNLHPQLTSQVLNSLSLEWWPVC